MAASVYNLEDWRLWMDRVLAHPSFPLQARPCPNDAGNENDPAVDKASLHINASSSGNVPLMIGLITTKESADGDDDGIILQEILEEQIRPLRTAEPLFGFVAHGKTQLTMFVWKDGSAGHDPQSGRLDVNLAERYPEILERGDSVRDHALRQVLLEALTDNLVEIARSPMRRARSPRM